MSRSFTIPILPGSALPAPGSQAPPRPDDGNVLLSILEGGLRKTLGIPYFGNPLWAWLLVVLVALIAGIGSASLRRLLRSRLAKDAADTPQGARELFLHVARSTSLPLLLLGVTAWSTQWILALPDKAERFLRLAALWSLAAQGAFWLHAAIGFVVDRSELRAGRRDPSAGTMIRTLGLSGKVLLWVLTILLALHNAGVNITALAAGLGIGGVAVALALQNILADVFASISILLDKPYQVGDFIAVGDSMGTVERIGIKTTRIRSLSGEQLVFSNAELLKTRIRNFKRLTERRVEFSVGAAYSTPYAKVELIPTILREAIRSQEHVRLERATFKEFGEASLTFECVYYVTEQGYDLFLGIQETINLEILRRFQEEEIELAHPSRTLYVAQGVAPVRW